MKEFIISFTSVQSHPETGMPLSHRFIRVKAKDAEAAREIVERHFAKKWGFIYESEAAAGVKKFGLTELYRDDWPKPIANHK